MSGLGPCTACAAPVAFSAKSCPSCGQRNPHPLHQKAAAVVISIVVILAASIWAFSGKAEPREAANAERRDRAIELPLTLAQVTAGLKGGTIDRAEVGPNETTQEWFKEWKNPGGETSDNWYSITAWGNPSGPFRFSINFVFTDAAIRSASSEQMEDVKAVLASVFGGNFEVAWAFAKDRMDHPDRDGKKHIGPKSKNVGTIAIKADCWDSDGSYSGSIGFTLTDSEILRRRAGG